MVNAWGLAGSWQPSASVWMMCCVYAIRKLAVERQLKATVSQGDPCPELTAGVLPQRRQCLLCQASFPA